MMQIFKKIGQLLVSAIAILTLCTGCNSLTAINASPWEFIQLPTDATIQDISMIDHDHGWLVGNRSTLLETHDAGQSWAARTLEAGDLDYRFNSVSFKGDEGWIVGEPAILLHTTDGGSHWEQIPLNAKLPGAPTQITATGPNSAEMVTDVGAVYATQDAGRNWSALMKEAFGVTRNVSRSPDGSYVAVSSRGSFYSLWSPGQESWDPHNRNSSRRVQGMGFTPNGHLWMLNRGGLIQFAGQTVEDWSDPINPAPASGLGLLDLAFRTPDEIWVAGGAGRLLRSLDQGKTWQVDETVADVPSNFYRILFFGKDQGFVTGQDGVLLRYIGAA
jgi:photosystem II stability/assembly factor-like uncharacterized protein